MTKHAIDDLEIVAVADGSPRALPWRPLPQVAQRIGHPEEVIWVTERFANDVYGHDDDAGELDRAIEEQLATRLPEPIRAVSNHVVVRGSEGFEYIEQDEAIRRRRKAQRRAIETAVSRFRRQASEDAIREAFEGAFTIDASDTLVAALRAGFACHTGDDEWQDIALTDLERAIDRSGPIEPMLRRPDWHDLPDKELRRQLLQAARRGLDERIERAAERRPPISLRHQRLGAALAIFRADRARRLPLPHALLACALDGEPESVEKAWEILLHRDDREDARRYYDASAAPPDDWHQGSYARFMARATTSDLLGFAATLSTLESCSEASARDGRWHAFTAQTAGLQEHRVYPVAPWKQGEELAEALRRRLDLDGERVPSVTDLLTRRAGTHTGMAPLPSDGIHAAAVAPSHVPPCIFVEASCSAAASRALRNRFAMMHELAHLLVDRDRGSSRWICATNAEGADGSSSPAEARANAFAAYVLAPRHAVEHYVPATLPTLGSSEFIELALGLRDRFGLSAGASAQHLINCVYDTKGRLPDDVRDKVHAADQDRPTTEFPRDLTPDPPELDELVTAPRGGKFAALVRQCIRIGAIDLGEGALVLGVDPPDLEAWLAHPALELRQPREDR